MAISEPLPAKGTKDWYDHYSDIHNTVNILSSQVTNNDNNIITLSNDKADVAYVDNNFIQQEPLDKAIFQGFDIYEAGYRYGAVGETSLVGVTGGSSSGHTWNHYEGGTTPSYSIGFGYTSSAINLDGGGGGSDVTQARYYLIDDFTFTGPRHVMARMGNAAQSNWAMGCVLAYVDSSNYLVSRFLTGSVSIVSVVAGVSTTLASQSISSTSDSYYDTKDSYTFRAGIYDAHPNVGTSGYKVIVTMDEDPNIRIGVGLDSATYTTLCSVPAYAGIYVGPSSANLFKFGAASL